MVTPLFSGQFTLGKLGAGRPVQGNCKLNEITTGLMLYIREAHAGLTNILEFFNVFTG